MTPKKTTINSILCLAVAINCWAEDNISNKTGFASTGNPAVMMAVSSEDADVRRLTSLGFQYLLTGYDDGARICFREATARDGDCMLAHTGMLMVAPAGSDTYRNHLRRLNELLQSTWLTPVEEWYLSTFLLHISGDLHGAAAAFKERAASFRKDTMAACWDIILSHYSGREERSALLSRADSLPQKHPDNGLVHFCRALPEEYESSPSETAKQCASKAAELLPQNPGVQLLAGKLFHNKPDTALRYFQNVLRLTPENSEVHLATQLSLISAHIASGTRDGKIQALQIARKIAQNTPQNAPECAYALLSHWEARTALLRLLVLQETAPGGHTINTAAEACNAVQGDTLELVQNCLVEAIRTRALADSNRKSAASVQLKKAEEYFERLQRAGEDITRKGGFNSICFKRASQACMGALYRAKISLYPSSRDIWQEHLDEVLSIPQPRLLPPVLPHIIPQK